MTFWRQTRAIARRDLVVEGRSRETVAVVLPFAAAAVFVVPFATDALAVRLATLAFPVYWLVGLCSECRWRCGRPPAETLEQRRQLAMLGVDPVARFTGRVASGSVLILVVLASPRLCVPLLRPRTRSPGRGRWRRFSSSSHRPCDALHAGGRCHFRIRHPHLLAPSSSSRIRPAAARRLPDVGIACPGRTTLPWVLTGRHRPGTGGDRRAHRTLVGGSRTHEPIDHAGRARIARARRRRRRTVAGVHVVSRRVSGRLRADHVRPRARLVAGLPRVRRHCPRIGWSGCCPDAWSSTASPRPPPRSACCSPPCRSSPGCCGVDPVWGRSGIGATRVWRRRR
jgi:hypothetical protein